MAKKGKEIRIDLEYEDVLDFYLASETFSRWVNLHKNLQITKSGWVRDSLDTGHFFIISKTEIDNLSLIQLIEKIISFPILNIAVSTKIKGGTK